MRVPVRGTFSSICLNEAQRPANGNVEVIDEAGNRQCGRKSRVGAPTMCLWSGQMIKRTAPQDPMQSSASLPSHLVHFHTTNYQCLQSAAVVNSMVLKARRSTAQHTREVNRPSNC